MCPTVFSSADMKLKILAGNLGLIKWTNFPFYVDVSKDKSLRFFLYFVKYATILSWPKNVLFLFKVGGIIICTIKMCIGGKMIMS